MARADAATGLKPAYSFEQLVIGPNNHVAAAACREVLKSPGEMYNPLIIYGPAGVGKTHLMQAVAHEMLVSQPTCKVKYISAERFMSEIVTSIAEDRVVDVRKAYSALDLLIMDDVQYLVESKVAQEELFHIFNNLHQENRQVILAADRMPNQLSALSKAIQSRLGMGLSTDIQAPDEPTRLEILRRKQAAQGLTMSDDMLLPVAKALKSNVRELEGFLKRIHAYVNLSHQPLSLELVKAVIRELAPDAPDFASNGAGYNDESPGLPPAPGVAPALTKVLNLDVANGHKNGNGNGNGAAKNGHDKPFPVEPPVYEKPAPAPPPPPEPPRAVPAELSDILSKKEKATAPPPPAPAPVAAKPAPAPEPPVIKKVEAPPAPAPIPVPEELPPPEEEGGDLPAGHKEVTAVFFYPDGKIEALETIYRKFQDVIKKHKLKFRLKRVFDQSYAFKGKINYAAFAESCKEKKVPVAIVVGPPPESLLNEQDFYNPLTAALDAEGVSLQLVNWGELSKDYRYLNLALDIALVRSK